MPWTVHAGRQPRQPRPNDRREFARFGNKWGRVESLLVQRGKDVADQLGAARSLKFFPVAHARYSDTLLPRQWLTDQYTS
jgi:hypothetical protein